MNVYLFILLCVSITNIVSREYVFEWLRTFIDKTFHYSILNKIIRCGTCLGFWVGLTCYFLFSPVLLNCFTAGLLISISVKTYEAILLKF